MEISIINSISQACCGVISICTEKGNSAEVNVLILHEKPLGYDMLIEIDVIQALSSIEIPPTGKVELGRKSKMCATITTEEPDFCTTFDHKEKACTAR